LFYVFVAISGIILTTRLSAATSIAGNMNELDAIATCFYNSGSWV
jgi:ABC-type xylose transport system permease subunit